MQIITEYLTESLSELLLTDIGISLSELTTKKQADVKRKADWEEELEIEKETIGYVNSLGTKAPNNISSLSSSATIKSTSGFAQDAKKAKQQIVKPAPAGVKSITSFFSKK